MTCSELRCLIPFVEVGVRRYLERCNTLWRFQAEFLVVGEDAFDVVVDQKGSSYGSLCYCHIGGASASGGHITLEDRDIV